ncbi:TRAP transporter permease [Thermodesulfobacteriota bacterium]
MHRDPRGFYNWLCVIFPCVGLGATIFYVFRMNIAGKVMMDSAFLALLLGVFLPSTFIIYPATKKAARDKVPWYDQILVWLSLLGPAFVFIFALRLTESMWPLRPPPFALAIGLITWGLLLEAVRRTAGPAMAIIVGILSVYPLFASYMPGPFFAKSYAWERLVGFHFLTTQSVYGMPLHVFGTLIIGFMVFGMALDAAGASKFMLDLSQGLMGRFRGGPAMVSVLASALMSSLSGSAMANVVSTGSVTIPAMKKAGYPSHMAGAIEAVASNAGMLTPPVMGAVAFVMAGMLQIPYAWIVVAAAIPIIIFYISLFASVFTYAQKNEIPALPENEIPSVKKTLAGGWFYAGAVVVLVYLLFWIRVEAWAPYYATLFLIFCAFLKKETRPNWRTLYNFIKGLGCTLSLLAVIMAGVGLLMGGLELTGVVHTLASDLVKLAKGNLYMLLFLGAIGSFVLGMGGAMVAIYIFMALIFAPTLVQVGIYPLSSHMFFMYWATLSCITPPVCTTVFTACAISGSSPMRTGITAVGIAISIYLIPFAFVLNPALLLDGPWLVVLYSVVTATAGGVFLAFAHHGFLIRFGNLRIITRIVFFVVGFILFFRPLDGAVGAAVIVLAILLVHFVQNRYTWGGAVKRLIVSD